MHYPQVNNPANKFLVAGSAVFGIIIMLISLSLSIVSEGHVGLIKRTGRVMDRYLKPGLHGKAPFFDSVIEIDIRMMSDTHRSVAFSKDLQGIQTEATLQYSLNPSLVIKAFRMIGDREDIQNRIVTQAISNSLKAVTTLYTAEELVTKRMEIKTNIYDSILNFIDDSLQEKNLTGLIIPSNLALTDFQFSKEFNQAIEEKVRAEQEALKAKNEKEKRITQAEAEARERELKADAEAYEKEKLASADAAKIRTLAEAESFKVLQIAEANARAIEQESKALAENKEFIQYRLARNWDGKLPVIHGLGGASPLLDIDGILDLGVETDKKIEGEEVNNDKFKQNTARPSKPKDIPEVPKGPPELPVKPGDFGSLFG